MSNRRPCFEDLPLFADDASLGAALLGPDRACEWRDLAPLYERRGLPKIDEMMGGRYTPAVKAFFDWQYKLTGAAPAVPDGVEHPEAWSAKPARLRRV